MEGESSTAENEKSGPKISPRRKFSLAGDDTDSAVLAYHQNEELLPLKEDLSEWLTNTLGVNICAQNFMDVLDNGVYICKLAKLIQDKAEEAVKTGSYKQKLPKYKIKWRDNAKSGSWFARDNTAGFLAWCRNYGVMEECLFESDGLVAHKQERNVVLCLLELARMGMKFGIEPPCLIKLEKEIEKEELETEKVTVTPNATPKKRSSSPSKHPKQRASRSKSQSSKSPYVDELDTAVKRLSGQCSCQDCFPVRKITDGRYNIAGKNVFIRMLQGKHLMVRVGGGWDTLVHYLKKHDPCRVTSFQRNGLPSAVTNGNGYSSNSDSYLHIKGNYRPKSAGKS